MIFVFLVFYTCMHKGERRVVMSEGTGYHTSTTKHLRNSAASHYKL